MDSAGMTVHAIDQENGKLNVFEHYPMGTRPNWVDIVDLQ
jgi:hypothetical protein